jgi:serine phosphatase RsbU (regulator of sigma subunit)
MSSLGYLVIVFIQISHPMDVAPEGFTNSIYFIYAALILLGGLIAAGVSSQVRGYVTAALRESELQAQVERMNHDLEIAQSIQEGLLPAYSPRVENFEIAGWNQPADQTGGDYFDWQELQDGRIAVSLGDATGHGIGPSLVSSSCRAYARASVLASNDHDGLLNRLNKLLADDLSANRFVTFAVMFLDPQTGEVDIHSAGHGPIIIYRRETDAIENIDAHGIPLGMIAHIGYAEGTKKQLNPGDMLIVVTDGFYEWEDPSGEQFGLNRLEDVIRESRDKSAEELIAALRESVIKFCKGTKQQDDLTAVVVRRKMPTIVG